jgi:hypothetical protein
MLVEYNPGLDDFTMEPNIEEDPQGLKIFEGITQFYIEEGCQALSCFINKPSVGHNGPCICFRKVPTYLRAKCIKEYLEFINE